MGAEGSTGPWIVGSMVLKKAGVVAMAGSGAPTNGTSGTGAGKIALSGIYYDYLFGVTWCNVGTKASPVWSPNGSYVPLSVTSANILAMFATPVTIIAAPPVGYAIVVNNVMWQMTRSATAYVSGGVVSLVYTGGAVSPHSGTVPASVITGGAGVVLNQNGPVSAANGIVVPTNTGIDITNATGAFTTGTGTLRVYVDYSIVKQ